MLALRLGNGELAADVPLSAAVRAELGPDGMPRALQGRIVGGAGRIGDARNAAAGVLIDEMQSEVHWDAASRTLRIPIEVHAGANRLALLGVVAPPAEKGGAWSLSVSQGMVVLASAARPAEPPLMLDRLAVRAHFDPASQHLTIEQFDLRGVGAGVAGSGLIDFSGAQAQLKVGIAATSMSAVAFKRLWPAVVTPQLREWIEQNVLNGTVEKVDISTNMPLTAMLPDTPPLTNGSLWIGIKAKGATMRPIEGLPPVRDADIEAQVNGRSASLIFGRGTLDLPSGRKLTIAGGSFDVADVSMPRPPARGRVRVEGGLDAVGELLNMEPLRHSGSSLPFDLNTTRGTIAAQVGVTFPLYKGVGRSAVRYAVEAEVANFAAEKFFRGLKGEAPHLRVNATQDLLQIKGDMRIGGTPAAVDYRMARGASDAEVRIQAALDETLRSKLGLDLGSALSGTIPVKLAGRMKVGDRDGQETRLNVEADLTPARITDLVPGWSKPPGRSARTSFVLVDKGHSIRLEDFTLDGSGANVRGNLEIDADGELISASLPTFAVSDGDKASLKAERGNDGVLRLTLRGDLYDGRGLVKSSVAGHKPDKRTRGADLDLDIKVGAMTGYHGEALRSLDLKMSRRGGNIRSFSMTGKLGRDARISGDLRGRGSGGRMVIYLEAHDAGALFRFTDIYARIYGGSVSIAMDPPVLDNTPREGLLNVKDFYVRGERVLDSVAASGVDPNNPNAQRGLQAGQGVFFSRLRAEFTRSPGRFAIREGVVWGPNIGATVDGHIDYTRDEARLRGTFVPAYALNNLFSRLPVLGFFLGGNENEGLLGVTFQVVGTPTNPILQVNPMSAVAPGFLRKLFEFRGAGGDGAGERTGQIPQQFR
ncbi:MAG: hypothetical protein IT538_08145, partial [Variibacter sp.]|nr:hypothetical protein [Variibacter sp.]